MTPKLLHDLLSYQVQHLEVKSRQGPLERAIRTGEDVRQEIERLCAQFGVIARQRKLHLGMLVWAMVVATRTPGGAYQADILRSYLEFEVPRVARSAFHRWFDEPLERFRATWPSGLWPVPEPSRSISPAF